MAEESGQEFLEFLGYNDSKDPPPAAAKSTKRSSSRKNMDSSSKTSVSSRRASSRRKESMKSSSKKMNDSSSSVEDSKRRVEASRSFSKHSRTSVEESGQEFLEVLGYSDAKTVKTKTSPASKTRMDSSAKGTGSSRRLGDSSKSSNRMSDASMGSSRMSDSSSRRRLQGSRSFQGPSGGTMKDTSGRSGGMMKDTSGRMSNTSKSRMNDSSKRLGSSRRRMQTRNSSNTSSPKETSISPKMKDTSRGSSRRVTEDENHNSLSSIPDLIQPRWRAAGTKTESSRSVTIPEQEQSLSSVGDFNTKETQIKEDEELIAAMESDLRLKFGGARESLGIDDLQRGSAHQKQKRPSMMDRFKDGLQRTSNKFSTRTNSSRTQLDFHGKNKKQQRPSLLFHMQDLLQNYTSEDESGNMSDLMVDDEKPGTFVGDKGPGAFDAKGRPLDSKCRPALDAKCEWSTSYDGSGKKPRRALNILCWIASFAATVIGLLFVIRLLTRVGEKPKASPTERSIDISQIPTSSRKEALKFIVHDQFVSNADHLKRADSPASRALEWIAKEDKAQLGIPGIDEGHDTVASLRAILQRYALAVFYFSQESAAAGQTSKRRLEADLKWTTSDPVCDWPGITCNGESLVTSINLSSGRLEGTLPQEIFSGSAFPAMTSLDLSDNLLHDGLPFIHHIASISKIGVAPVIMPLKELHLQHNSLKGWINKLDVLEDLEHLDLSNNEFAGKIPTSITSLTKLTTLDIADNKLHGKLSTFEGLSHLESLHLDANQFTGTLPSQWSALTSLRILHLGHNEGITGTIPSSPWNHLTNMQSLDLRETGLVGTIPTTLSRMTNLEDLSLHGTGLEGTMPTEICELRSPDGPLTDLTACCKEGGPIKCEGSCCTDCFKEWAPDRQIEHYR